MPDLVAFRVATQAGHHDVFLSVFAAFGACLEVFCGALETADMAWGQPHAFGYRQRAVMHLNTLALRVEGDVERRKAIQDKIRVIELEAVR